MTRRPLIILTLLVFAAGVGTGLGAAPAGSQGHDDHGDAGAETGRHRHPGPTIIYMLEGELSETAPEGITTLNAGEAVWRPAREEHNVRNVSGRPARARAIHLDPAP